MRDLLDESSFKMTHLVTFDEFVGALAKVEEKKPAETRRLEEAKKHARLYFDELHAKEAALHEEQAAKQRRLEERYLELLEDYYYRSDHIGTSWKDAEYDMRKRSAFLDMKEADRKPVFEKHMAGLAKKMGKVPCHSQYSQYSSPNSRLLISQLERSRRPQRTARTPRTARRARTATMRRTQVPRRQPPKVVIGTCLIWRHCVK